MLIENMNSDLVKTLNFSWKYENYVYSHILSLEQLGLYYTNHFFNEFKLERPDKLFKFYSNNDKNLDSIEKGYFWLSHPSYFNDPFDCLANRDESIIKKRNISDNIIKHRNNIGVSCFSLDNNSAIMWGHYANKFNGFTIEFEHGEIHKNKNLDILAHVSYLKEYKPSTFIESYNKLIEKLYSTNLPMNVKLRMNNMIMILYEYCWKQKEWSYENEYRIISITSENFGRKLFFEKNQITSFYIGYKMPIKNKEYYDNLLDIIRINYPKAKIFIVKPHPLFAELVFNSLEV